MRGARWFVGVGALAVALLALYVLTRDGSSGGGRAAGGSASPAMDDIDARSREQMREILREAGDEE